MGPGSHLKEIVAGLGIFPTESCKCEQYRKRMDNRGAKWCCNHVPKIMSWLRQSARRRRIPFVNFVVKPLVLLAISRALADLERK